MLTPPDIDGALPAFSPPWWLKNRHLQTIYPTLPWAGAPVLTLRRQALELPDGDITAVDWLENESRAGGDTTSTRTSSPLLILLHGLEGSADSPYARLLMQAASEKGWTTAVLHSRDCGDYRNRLPRRYHAGETADIRFFVDGLRTAGYSGPLLAVGFSLGGNVLLKYLGESREETPLHAAAAVSVPLNLHHCAEALSQGFSRIYQKHLIKRMKTAVQRKFNAGTAAFDWQKAMSARTFAEFDDAVTAPLHGFAGKDDYYDRCSSIGYLNEIARPTLILNSLDDPFLSEATVLDEQSYSKFVTYETSTHGGHVGFIDGGTPWRPQYYLPARLLRNFEQQIADRNQEL